MPFTPRTQEQILRDMIAYVQQHSQVSDFTVGSVARTMLEAAAIEDDEQYFQMTQLLDAFSLYKARGESLDRRVAEFGIRRRQARAAVTRVKFYDNNLIRTNVGTDAIASDTIVYGFDTSKFPTSGYPYVVRLGEGTTRAQDVSVLANNPTTGQLTLSAGLTYDAQTGDIMSLVTGATAKSISIGRTVMVPATASQSALLYSTTEQAFIDAGNYFSNEVLVKCTTNGSAGNVVAGRITQFSSSPPFTGAGVVSTADATSGADRETDDELVERAIQQIASLSRGTPLALKSSAQGIEDPTTGQTVLSANLVEDFDNDEVILYIDDGTGFTPDSVTMADTTLVSYAASPPTVTLTDSSDFPSAGRILILSGGLDTPELLTYTSNDGATILNLDSAALYSHTAGDVVKFVEMLAESTETDQTYFRLRTFPVVRNTEEFYKLEPGGTWELMPSTDYFLNKGTGEVQLYTALPAGSQIVSNHQYYINLIATVQKVLEGDPDDEVNFPGVKAAGVILSVEAPTIKRITVRVSITAKAGFAEADLYDSVRSAIETYVSSLRLGENVVVSRIIDSAHNVAGVYSVTVLDPLTNIVVLENELPSPYDTDGNSLVGIT